MVLHGYTVMDAALLEASNPYKLRAVVQHQMKLAGGMSDREPLLKAFNDAIAAQGFATIFARLVDATTGLDADEFDDDMILVIDTKTEHHVTHQ